MPKNGQFWRVFELAENLKNQTRHFGQSREWLRSRKVKLCAFCQVASHVFQTLKGLISSDLVEFVSVDASANDLPWAFTALAVPSVLYFHPNSGSSTSSKPKAQQDQGMKI